MLMEVDTLLSPHETTPAGEEKSAAANQPQNPAAAEGHFAADGREALPQTGAPEEYGGFKVPEGFIFEEEDSRQFNALAKELNLPQDKAQKLIDKYVEKQQNQFEFWQEQHLRQVHSWTEEVKMDPEIGRGKFDESVGVALKALEQFGTPQLRKLLRESGYGSHPEFVKMFHRVGKALAEDKFAQGVRAPGTTDLGDLFFPNSK